jgi:hypothetical protein
MWLRDGTGGELACRFQESTHRVHDLRLEVNPQATLRQAQGYGLALSEAEERGRSRQMGKKKGGESQGNHRG